MCWFQNVIKWIKNVFILYCLNVMILLWCAMEYVSLHFLLQCFSFALHNTFVHNHLPLIHFFPFSFLDKYSFNTNVTVHNFGPLLRFEAHVYQLLSSCIISSKQLQPVHTAVVEVGAISVFVCFDILMTVKMFIAIF